MGIYLPNIEMPRKKQMLVIFTDGTSYVCFNGMRERLAQTEAISIPPHGRLIDVDTLEDNSITYYAIPVACINVTGATIKEAELVIRLKDIDAAPAIIPAEEEEHTMEEFMYGQEGNPNDGHM